MKKLFLFLFFLFFASVEFSYACDGCSFYSYNSLFQNHYAGFFWRQRVFNGYDAMNHAHRFPAPRNGRVAHEPEENGLYVDKTRKDFEVYQTLEWRGQFQVSKNWVLLASLPYRFARVHYERVLQMPLAQKDTTMQTSGMGDALLMVRHFQNFGEDEGLRHQVSGGFGLFLPTGQHQQRLEGELHDPLLQPGTGAWGAVLHGGYAMLYSNWAFRAEGQYRRMTQGTQRYRLGDSGQAIVTGEYQIALSPEFQIIPRLGVQYEARQKDSFQGEAVSLSGGETLFGLVALDLAAGRWAWRTSYRLPVYERLNGTQIGTAGEVSAGLLFRW